MAEIIGGGEPVNDAERMVIRHLRDHGPADWVVLHNFELPLRDGRNAVVALGWGAADSGMAFPFRGWMSSASSPAAAGRAAGTRRRRTATGAGANRRPSQPASAPGATATSAARAALRAS